MKELLTVKEIEKVIHKKYKKQIWNKFIQGINEFDLIKTGDKLAIAISGGKDSLLLAKLFQILRKTTIFDFELEFISMNPGFNEENLNNFKENLEYLGIKCEIFNTEVFNISKSVSKESPCYICARMRRGALYSKAEELGCNKVVLGHHFDDVVETIMLSMLYSGSYQTMMPKIKSQNFKGLELIRPMYFVEEEDIISYTKEINLNPMDCGCTVTSGESSSKRKDVKEIINKLDQKDKEFKWRIYKSSTNINIEKVIGYKTDNKKVNFLDDY